MSDMVKEYETRMDEKIKTGRDNINNEETSSLEEYESDPDDEDNEKIPLEYDNNGRPKINKKKPKQYKPSFQGKHTKKGAAFPRRENGPDERNRGD